MPLFFTIYIWVDLKFKASINQHFLNMIGMDLIGKYITHFIT